MCQLHKKAWVAITTRLSLNFAKERWFSIGKANFREEEDNGRIEGRDPTRDNTVWRG
jgi:hypothetical protein